MAQNQLKLGKGATFFVKSQLKRLRQEDETWEADFQGLPKRMTQTETRYMALVVNLPHGVLLAESEAVGSPSVNDFASLLANAMFRPLTEESHLPRRIHVRGHRQWRELFHELEEIGIEVSVRRELPKVKEAYKDRLRQMQEAHRATMDRPTKEQAQVEELFPAIAKWVRDGHIEIGDQEGFGFVVRAVDYGGVVFEDDRPNTLAEAMAALEKGLRKWFDEQGIELE